MRRTALSHSEAETQKAGAALAEELFEKKPAFVQLKGSLGAGKTAFARGFITRWSALAADPTPETIVSPTYNIAKVYGNKAPIAHLDLYRLKNIGELEELGFEHYFYEMSCCIVEWLEQLPEAQAAKPLHTVCVGIEMQNHPEKRTITIDLPEPTV